MKPDQLVAALESAALQLGVKVRYDSLGPQGVQSGGGLCRLRGQWTVIVDKKASPADKASVLVDALATFDVDPLQIPGKAKQLLMVRRQSLLGGAPGASVPAA